jgi:hypothetical protein
MKCFGTGVLNIIVSLRGNLFTTEIDTHNVLCEIRILVLAYPLYFLVLIKYCLNPDMFRP